MAVATAGKSALRAQDGPVAIEVREVEKTFRIPVHRIDSFKERMVHPLAKPEYRILEALKKVSFEVHRGEFFGIVGRNGSGKSTLLKILASIYRADAGSIRMAGRVAPFIELGVGFNPDLTARENVTLNGVMVGLSRREARARLDAVLDFAELEEFVDLKLKNYSSGMMVRLAFSVMVQSDADVLLIDEVLAVGDAAFQQKCRDVFRQMRDGGRTVVLVTHDMTAVQSYCHRAMLLDEGRLAYLGDPEEAGRQYLRMNFAKRAAGAAGTAGLTLVPDFLARVREAWLEDDDGARIENIEAGRPIRLNAVLEARQDLTNPRFAVQFNNADGTPVFDLEETLGDDEHPVRIRAGTTTRIKLTVDENPLMPGRYLVACWLGMLRNEEESAIQPMELLEFVVFGLARGQGVVSIPGELDVRVGESDEGAPR
jgi:ABC-type polysaccharide/polyol phosphate transport system ATPase subunit